MATTPTSGRAAFLKLLVDEGVSHLFGNPGTTELAIMEVVPQFPELTYVLGLQESIVVGMADGFARASGRLTACNLHCAPGLGHAMGALYSAKFSGSPMIVTAGQYEVGYGLTEPLLYEPLVPIAAPLVKWAFEVPRVEDLPRVVRRAAKVAMAPPAGPVFLSLPGSILDDEADLDLGHPTRVERASRPSDELVARLAVRLLAAKRPVIVAGRELAEQGAFADACALAQMLGAAVYLESVPYNARYPIEHPSCLGDLGRNQAKAREALEPFDLLICLGADLLRMSLKADVEPLPEGLAVVHLSERDWELGKNYPTEIAVCANVRETLVALLPALEAKRSPDDASRAQARCEEIAKRSWSAQREARRASALASAGTPIAAAHLMARLVDALPADAIVVEEALTSTPALTGLLPMRDERGFYGLASGGLGFAMPGSVGIGLASPGRPVVAVVGDGSAMYGIQALWTAAHLRLPITYVIVNNRSYRIIKDRLVSLRGTDRFVGMDFRDPEIDFVAVARGLGVEAARVTDPADLPDALSAAFRSGAPRLIEVMVDDGYSGR